MDLVSQVAGVAALLDHLLRVDLALGVELPKVISKNELYSITDQSVRYNSNITPLKRVNMNLKKDHGSLSPRREQAYKS